MDRSSVSDLGGPLAVGSIAFLGTFLIVDGLNGLFILIEQYATTATWAILFAGPTLVLAYAFGVIAIQVADFARGAYDRRHGRDPLASFVSIARSNNEHLVARYRELRRTQEFLQGMSPALALLGVGSFFAVRWLGSFDLFGYAAGLGCLTLAALLPLVAHRLGLQTHALAEICEKSTEGPSTSAA